MDRFGVHPYSIDKLISILAEVSRSQSSTIKSKPHVNYFQEYFEHLDAQTIVVENDYTDRDFLDDYAAYYVRCFRPYRKKCTRLHFFKHRFSDGQVKSILDKDGAGCSLEDIQDSYLGFVVARPLPQAVIGRTCLRTYDEGLGRAYLGTRTYHANLFGIKLTIPNTLAFQEQDSTTAACATAALWSAFQATSKLFDHVMLTPAEITRIATTIPDVVVPNTFPNSGLTYKQILYAIKETGLEPRNVNVCCRTSLRLKQHVLGYLKAGIPIVLVFELWDTARDKDQSMGHHAVAITGFRTDDRAIEPIGKTKFKSTASKLSTIYTHDDGVGPFARMVFDEVSINGYFSLSTSWAGFDGTIGKVRAIPGKIILPLRSKIRIMLSSIESIVIKFDYAISSFFYSDNSGVSGFSGFEWEVHLASVNELKSAYLASSYLPKHVLRDVLTEGMPKYIWRAIAKHAGKPAFELLFDATDFDRGNPFIRAIEIDSTVYSALKAVFTPHVDKSKFQQLSYWNIMDWLARN